MSITPFLCHFMFAAAQEVPRAQRNIPIYS